MDALDEPEWTTHDSIVDSLADNSGLWWARTMADEWLSEARAEIAEQVSLLPEDASREEILETIRRGYTVANIRP